jgi:dienelactone hydrolase
MRRMISYLEATCGEWADVNNIFVAGFCFGGGLALRYADKYAERVRACAVFYGKPIKTLTGFDSNFYGVFGDKDRQFKPPDVNNLEKLLQSRSKSVEMRRYPNQAHAFVEDLECIRRGGDAADAWSGFIGFLENNCPKIEQREWGQVSSTAAIESIIVIYSAR